MLRKKSRDKITAAFSNAKVITKALEAGIKEALLKHKQAGKPIVVWKEDHAVWIPAEKIQIKEKKNSRRKK